MNTTTLRAALLAASVLGLGAASAHADPFSFQTVINPQDPTFNQLLGINDAGVIAGYDGSGLDAAHPNKGYTATISVSGPSFTPENFPGSVQTQVTGINNNGDTVGFYVDGAANNFGFSKANGTSFLTLNNAKLAGQAAVFEQNLGINDKGQIVGFYNAADGTPRGYAASLATNQLTATIDATGPGGVALPTTPAAINQKGEVAGFYVGADHVTHGFLSDSNGGSFTSLDAPGASSTQFFGISNSEAVGIDVVGGVQQGVLFNLATDQFSTLNDPLGIGTTTINGVNDLGQLVGFYTDAAGNVDGFLATPTTVAEPGSIAMLLAGSLAVVGARRRVMAG